MTKISPKVDSLVEREIETDLVIDWVPGNTVHCPHVAAEHCDGIVPLHVVDVDLRGEVM